MSMNLLMLSAAAGSRLNPLIAGNTPACLTLLALGAGFLVLALCLVFRETSGFKA